MNTTELRAPVSPGEPAPEFALPTVEGTGTVSLADYRGKSSVFLALFIGLWCPFCRRAIAQMASTEPELKALGVETLAVVATPPENARLYFKFRPCGLRVAADPALATHRAYGVPKPASTPEMRGAPSARRVAIVLCRCASNSALTRAANSGAASSTSRQLVMRQ